MASNVSSYTYFLVFPYMAISSRYTTIVKRWLPSSLHRILFTINWKWVGAYVRPIGMLSHQNLIQCVMKVELYEEACPNGIL